MSLPTTWVVHAMTSSKFKIIGQSLRSQPEECC